MNPQAHWEAIYRTQPAAALSWSAPHLDVSLHLIDSLRLPPHAAILDAGGGASTLVDDLLARAFTRLTVLDLSPHALAMARARLGPAAAHVRWLSGDITRVALPPARYRLWHDRALFHFLVTPQHRAAYARRLLRALKPGGYAILSTFGPAGPAHCSGLPVVPYDAPALLAALAHRSAPPLRLLESRLTLHPTPSGVPQQFLSCLFERPAPAP
jgi:SAM-dependent methyltransferase